MHTAHLYNVCHKPLINLLSHRMLAARVATIVYHAEEINIGSRSKDTILFKVLKHHHFVTQVDGIPFIDCVSQT